MGAIRPVLAAKIVAGAFDRPVQLSGGMRASRNVAEHAMMGKGADALAEALVRPQRSQRGGRKRRGNKCGGSNVDSTASGADLEGDGRINREECVGKADLIRTPPRERRPDVAAVMTSPLSSIPSFPLGVAANIAQEQPGQTSSNLATAPIVIRRRFGRPSVAARGDAANEQAEHFAASDPRTAGPLRRPQTMQAAGLTASDSSCDSAGVFAGLLESHPLRRG